MWRPKLKAPCEASGEVPAQLRLSREDKGKMPLQFASIAKTISREAKLVSLPSAPNLRGVTHSVNFALTSEVTNGVANAALVPKGTSKILSRKTGIEALSSANHLHYKAENKAPQMTSLSKSSTAKSALWSKVKRSSLGADSSLIDR